MSEAINVDLNIRLNSLREGIQEARTEMSSFMQELSDAPNIASAFNAGFERTETILDSISGK